MSRQRRKHRASVSRSKHRRAVRRRAAEWRWQHDYWGPDVYGKVSAWLLAQVIPKLLGLGAGVLRQHALLPCLLIHDQITMNVGGEQSL